MRVVQQHTLVLLVVNRCQSLKFFDLGQLFELLLDYAPFWGSSKASPLLEATLRTGFGQNSKFLQFNLGCPKSHRATCHILQTGSLWAVQRASFKPDRIQDKRQRGERSSSFS